MMKTKLIYMLMMVLGVMSFTACSDDDDATTYDGDKLKLTVSNMTMNGKSVELDGNTLTLNGVIPGEDKTEVVLTENAGVYTGTNNNADRELTVKAVVTEGVMNLNVDMKSKSSLVGTWKLSAAGKPIPLFLDVEYGDDMAEEDKKDIENIKTTVTFVGALVLPGMLRTITLQENGNIRANYATDPMHPDEYVDSPEGMALFNISGNTIYVSVDVAGLLAGTPAKSADPRPLNQLIQQLSNGLPLLLKEEEGQLKIYVTREMMLPYMDLLESLTDLTGDLNINLGGMDLDIGTLIPQVVKTVTLSTKADLGLALTK